MPTMISMVPLREPAMPELDGIASVLKEKWPDLPAAARIEDDGEGEADKDAEESDTILSFSLGEDMIFAALMPAPIPWSELEGPCATSILWENAEEELKPSTAHLIVTVMSQTEEPFDVAVTLTQATAAIASSMSQAIGIYWGNATLVVPTDLFMDMAAGLLPEPPIPIWIDLRVGSNDSGGMAGFTQGMTALGHMDFETEDSPDSVGELRERFFGLASYVIENGPVIKDGDTIGHEGEERVRVIYSPSAFGQDEQVMRLEWQRQKVHLPRAKKPWWKFW